jgi:hypothetical protein
MTTKSQLWRAISYRTSNGLLVHKGSSRYARWYVIDDSGPRWRYLTKGVDSREAAFAQAAGLPGIIITEEKNL